MTRINKCRGRDSWQTDNTVCVAVVARLDSYKYRSNAGQSTNEWIRREQQPHFQKKPQTFYYCLCLIYGISCVNLHFFLWLSGHWEEKSVMLSISDTVQAHIIFWDNLALCMINNSKKHLNVTMILKCDCFFCFLKSCLLRFKCQTVLYGMVILTFCLLWFMVQKLV